MIHVHTVCRTDKNFNDIAKTIEPLITTTKIYENTTKNTLKQINQRNNVVPKKITPLLLFFYELSPTSDLFFFETAPVASITVLLFEHLVCEREMQEDISQDLVLFHESRLRGLRPQWYVVNVLMIDFGIDWLFCFLFRSLLHNHRWLTV